MSERYYFASYWRGRPEPLETYARRAERFFAQLGRLDPDLTQWFETAYSKEKALRSQFVPDLEIFLKFFNKKKYKSQAGDISFTAWNGKRVDGSSVKFFCGSKTPEIIVDCCFIYLAGGGSVAERLLREPMHIQALRAIVESWDPEWGVVTSSELRDTVSESGTVGTFVGWITYLSKTRGPIPPLPAPVRVEPVEDKGTLIILTPERCTASNPEHVALAAQVQEILGEAGLLKPVTESP
jgi:hypothetical protein